ncbi:MAG: hypothetical protein HRU75_01145 [Planctomycetia bacterium]|nr:MAG: hypothetical protein HRU75_01145 [Planctomycetia bacterium]
MSSFRRRVGSTVQLFVGAFRGIGVAVILFIGLVLGARATDAADFPEVEPNSRHADANAVTLACNDTISGTSTGSSFGATSALGSADFFRIKTAAAPLGIYEHRLTLFTTAGFGHSTAINGLPQSGGVINTGSFTTAQAGAPATSPPRLVSAWYGFGKQEEVYYRVNGSSTTTAAYLAQLTCTPVTPTAGPVLLAGDITITTAGQGHTTNTDMWVYDANLDAVAGYGNDNDLAGGVTQSTLTRSFAPGTYYLAISVANLANNLPSTGPNEGNQNGVVLDFPNAVTSNSLSFPTNCSVSFIDGIGANPVALSTAVGFHVLWVQFSVVAGDACCLGASCFQTFAAGCAAANGVFLGAGTSCGSPSCPVYEIEANESKATATPVNATSFSGITTGASTSTPGDGSADYWRFTSAATLIGPWRHRLILTSATPGHTMAIRGLSQSVSVIDPLSDVALQTSSTATTPQRFVQWYSLGPPSDLYVRVNGTAATTAPYVVTYEVEPPSTTVYPDALREGPITISTVGQGHSTDTDLWVYDSQFNPIVDFGNDDEPAGSTLQSRLTRTFAPGTYFLAISNFNVANSLASPADDDFRSGAVTDFAGVAVNSSVSAPLTINVQITDTVGGGGIPLAKDGPFDIRWVMFVVSELGECCVGSVCSERTQEECRTAGGYFYGYGTTCVQVQCPPVPEVESNSTKALAQVVALSCNGSIGGTSTGAASGSTAASWDYFRIETPAAPLGIYRHRLEYATTGPSCNQHTVTLRGLTQSGGIINAGSDAQLQAGAGVDCVSRFSQWYGFGKQEWMYYRVAGNTSTTGNYTATLRCEPVTPIEGPVLRAGNITIARSGHVTNTDFWVYDANLDPIAGFGNDEPNSLARTFFLTGTYYLAVSDTNLANNLASNMADEFFGGGPVTDSAGAVVGGSSASGVNLTMSFTDSLGTDVVAATKEGPFDVVWIRFTVDAFGACCIGGSCEIEASSTCAATGGLFFGADTLCAAVDCPDFNEVEPNSVKSQATAVTLGCGGTFGGVTTGSTNGTGIASQGSADYWRVKTAPLPLGKVWRHRLVLHSDTPGHNIWLLGLLQNNGVIDTASNAAIQLSSAATTPPRFIQWYSFGREEEVYCYVTGTAGTTAPYIVTHECEPVTIVDAGAFRPGSITITTIGQGHTTDTDLWVYGGGFGPILDYGNDDAGGGLGSSLTRTYGAPGTFYLAISRYNLANNLASPADDQHRNGAVLELPDAVLCSSTVSPVPLNVAFTDSAETVPVPLTTSTPYEVMWVRFEVADPGACCTASGAACSIQMPDDCRAMGGYFLGEGSSCGFSGSCDVDVEVEPNDTKAAAQLTMLPECSPGGIALIVAAGYSQGDSSATPGAESADYWRFRVPASTGIRQYTIFLTSRRAEHKISLLGLAQEGGVIDVGSEAIQMDGTSFSGMSPTVRWYGFGRQEEVVIKVTGTPGSVDPYLLWYYCDPVIVHDSFMSLAEGPITIETFSAGNSLDTDIWLFDSSLNALPDAGNDDGPGGAAPGSLLTRSLAVGSYLLAISERNLAVAHPSPADDLFRDGLVADSPDWVAGGGRPDFANTPITVRFTDGVGQFPVATAVFGQRQVRWVQFYVVPTGACCVDEACSFMRQSDCAFNGGYYFGDGSTCPVICPVVEAEPNETKATATAVQLDCGESIGGRSSGAVTSGGGTNSLDTFRIQTTAAPLGIYRHRLLYHSAGYTGATPVTHTPSLRGRTQTGGVINTTSDTAIQTGSTATSPPRYTQWYGFGKEESIFFRVTGSSALPYNYTAVLDCAAVEPIEGPTLLAGPITIARAGHTTNTDFWVYDANYNAIPDFGNDNPDTLTRTFAPGTYVLAISNSNLANNQPAATGDTNLTAGVTDFADALVNSSNSVNLDVSTRFTDAAAAQDVAATKVSPFDVVFIRFTVVPVGACCAADQSCQVTSSVGCAGIGGTYEGDGSVCTPSPCAAPCLAGDANCDGSVNNFDIDPFVQGVLDPSASVAPAAYLTLGGTQECWDQRLCWGDVNRDLALNNFDIDPFVACLISTPPAGEPCP